MQQLTYVALYVVLGLAALAYTVHLALTYPATWHALYRLIRRPRLRPVKEGSDHHDPAG